VFERYTEQARRAIFFGRYEAHLLHSPLIETEHLLLGILRDDKRGILGVPESAAAAIRRHIGQKEPTPELRASTAVDLPLSQETKRALALGAEESERLQQKQIDTPHLVLGLLRVEDSTAAKLLREQGLDYAAYRATVRGNGSGEGRLERATERAFDRPPPWAEERISAAAALLDPSIRALENLLDRTVAHIDADSDSYGEQRLKRKDWTRKQALGHLIDWAMAHQQWFARALLTSKLTAVEYPGEAAVTARHYAEYSWPEIVDLWVLLNRLLIHVLLRVPEDKLDVPFRIGIADPIQFLQLAERYVEHCEEMAGQVVAHL